MSTFKGFLFHDPKKTAAPESQDPIKSASYSTNPDESATVEALSERFEQVMQTNGESNSQSNRQESFRSFRTPLMNRTLEDTQEIRRKRALELQKKVRDERISQARLKALAGVSDEEDEEEDHQSFSSKRMRDSDDEMKESKLLCVENKYTPKKKGKGKNKNKKNFKYKAPEEFTDLVMYAETMEEVPEDLNTHWSMVVCPIGKRCVVTAARGETIVRSRSGRIMKRFQSNLPNGSKGSRASSSSDYCILDCLYDVEGWTFYVLDILCWKGYPIVDCDTEFRHFWLQTKLDPSELDRPTATNGFHKFIPLHRLPPTELPKLLGGVNEYVNQVLQRGYSVDGLLFYHNESKYTPGSTPLVCWAPLDQLGHLFLGQKHVAIDTEMGQ